MNNIPVLQPEFGYNIKIYKDETVIGRGEDCDITIQNLNVSRHHAIIERKGAAFFIKDLHSKNGTFVDSIRIGDFPVNINNGTKLSFSSKVHFTFLLAEDTLDESSPIQEKDDYGIQVNRSTHDVIIDGILIDPPLSESCYKLIELLTRETGRLYSYEQIYKQIWPEDEYFEIDGRSRCHDTKKQLIQSLKKSIPDLEKHILIQSRNRQGIQIKKVSENECGENNDISNPDDEI